MHDGAVVERVLRAYYGAVVPMREYLAELVPPSMHGALWAPVEPRFADAWSALLDGLVGVVTAAADDSRLATSPPPAPVWLTSYVAAAQGAPTMSGLLTHVQQALDAEGRHDVLLLGRRRTAGLAGDGGAAPLHPNTVLTSLAMDPAWTVLLQRIGAARVAHLLMHAAYFYPASTELGCYVQMWGVPLPDAPWRALAVRSPEARATPARVAPASITVRRGRLFHRRAQKVYGHGVVLGLPPVHVLHAPDGVRYHAATHRERRARVARVVRAMLPRAFGAPYPWDAAPPGVPSRARRWPRGLAPVARLVAALLRRHDRFRYDLVLEACCPSALPRGRATRERRERLATSFAGRTMAPATSPGTATQLAVSAAPTRGWVAPPPRFSQYATTQGRVAWYVDVVLRRVVPFGFFGSAHNRAVLRRGVARLVQARRHERITLHDAVQSFRTSECAWLAGRPAAQAHAWLCMWVWWLLDQLVLPLLQTSFYVTEAAAYRQRLLYFRQDLWERVSAPLVAALQQRLFDAVPRPLGSGAAAYATVRLLPKETTVRPLVNLGRRPRGAGRSVNAQLQSAYDVLAYEAARQGACGAAIGSLSAAYVRLLAYKARWSSAAWPRLYMIRADVRAAFDSLPHERVVALVRALVPSDAAYVVQRFTQLRAGPARPWKTQVRRVWPDDAYPTFVASAQARPSRHAVLVDGVAYTLERGAEVVSRIAAHVQQNWVRFGAALYRQRVGLPQGSVLSTLLCNMLLADAERMYLDVHADDCLLRFTDDFLYITSDAARAQRMARAMHDGFPAHHCRMAPEKMLVNFDALDASGCVVPRLPSHAPFPWCGVCVSPTTLACEPDTSRYPVHWGDVLAASPTSLGPVLVRSLQQRLGILFTDTTLNTPRGVYANVLEAFVVTAAKLHVLVRPPAPRTSLPSLVRSMEHAVRAAWPLMQAHAREARAAWHAGARCAVRRDCVEWLGWFAMVHVLQLWRTHAALVSHLRPHLDGRAASRKAQAAVGHLALEHWPRHRERVLQAM